MQVLDCTEQNSNGRHGLMYFDIALNYRATINEHNMNKYKLKTQNRIMIPTPNRLPSQIGFDMLTAKDDYPMMTTPLNLGKLRVT